MKLKAILIVLLLVIVVVSSAQGMSSTSYRLSWFTPLTGNGGGQANSAHYGINTTIGQTVIDSSASPHYQASMGYWAGITPSVRVYLPTILR